MSTSCLEGEWEEGREGGEEEKMRVEKKFTEGRGGGGEMEKFLNVPRRRNNKGEIENDFEGKGEGRGGRQQQQQQKQDEDAAMTEEEEEEDGVQVVVCGTSAEGTIDDFVREQGVGRSCNGGSSFSSSSYLPTTNTSRSVGHTTTSTSSTGRGRMGGGGSAMTTSAASHLHLGGQTMAIGEDGDVETMKEIAKAERKVLMRWEVTRDRPWLYARDKTGWFNYGFDEFSFKDWLQHQIDARIERLDRQKIQNSESDFYFQPNDISSSSASSFSSSSVYSSFPYNNTSTVGGGGGLSSVSHRTRFPAVFSHVSNTSCGSPIQRSLRHPPPLSSSSDPPENSSLLRSNDRTTSRSRSRSPFFGDHQHHHYVSSSSSSALL